MSWCQNVSVPEYLVVIMSGWQKGGVKVSWCRNVRCRNVGESLETQFEAIKQEERVTSEVEGFVCQCSFVNPIIFLACSQTLHQRESQLLHLALVH